MDVPQLRAHIADLEKLLAKMVSKQQAYFQDQLARLGSYVSKTASGVAATISPRSGKRAKARPKYQSKKKPSLKWSGRGMTPVWLREEMKETRLGKEDFLIRS
jgi:DNA-binding protein H-NS